MCVRVCVCVGGGGGLLFEREKSAPCQRALLKHSVLFFSFGHTIHRYNKTKKVMKKTKKKRGTKKKKQP